MHVVKLLKLFYAHEEITVAVKLNFVKTCFKERLTEIQRDISFFVCFPCADMFSHIPYSCLWTFTTLRMRSMNSPTPGNPRTVKHLWVIGTKTLTVNYCLPASFKRRLWPFGKEAHLHFLLNYIRRLRTCTSILIITVNRNKLTTSRQRNLKRETKQQAMSCKSNQIINLSSQLGLEM